MSASASSRSCNPFVVVLCAVALAPWAGPSAAAVQVIRPTGNPAKGRDVFISKGCVGCHSVRGAGGKTGPDLAVALVNQGILEIAAAMWSHAPAMAKQMASKGLKRPSLSPEEVRNLIAYLLFIGFTGEPGDPGNGRRLFNSKGCVNCHAFAGQGGKVGPSLDPMPRPLSPIGIAQEMWNHGPQMEEKMAEMSLQRPAFQRGEMADLVVFLLGSGRAELPSGAVSLPGDPKTGEQLFVAKQCSRCHRPDETGRTLGPDLSSGTWYNTSTELAAVMWNHGPAMAEATKTMQMELPRFEGNELADILAYLYVLKSGEQVGDAGRGRETFSSKRCSDCHGKDGPGPDLAGSAALESPAHLASAMWNHAPGMEQAASERGIGWPQLTGPQIRDLVAFLLSSGTVKNQPNQR